MGLATDLLSCNKYWRWIRYTGIPSVRGSKRRLLDTIASRRLLLDPLCTMGYFTCDVWNVRNPRKYKTRSRATIAWPKKPFKVRKITLEQRSFVLRSNVIFPTLSKLLLTGLLWRYFDDWMFSPSQPAKACSKVRKIRLFCWFWEGFCPLADYDKILEYIL